MSSEVVTRFGSGRAVARVEDPALVRGEGRFTDDVNPPGQCFAAFVRSTVAHGRIVAIDVAEALALPGVLAVHTGAELAAAGVKPIPLAPAMKRPDGRPMTAAPRRALAHEKVVCVGEPVALVVAETRAAAKAAAARVQVEYDELPAVTDPLRALQPDAPRVVDGLPDNVCAQVRHGQPEAVAAAFAGAAQVVKLSLVNQRLAPSPMEPRSVLAWMEGGRLVLRMSSQMPTAVRNGLADAIPGLKPEDVRVVVGDVGGGFGMKTGIAPEDIALGFAARALGRPIKWQAERLEDFLAAAHGRDLITDAELALDADGRVRALRCRSIANVGAAATTTGVMIQLLIGPWVTTSVYDIPLIDLHITAVLTNTAATGAYRGAGRPEAIYTIERLMDAAAAELGLDPAELRRRNLIRPDQMPYRNPMGQTYDVGQFEKMLDQGLQLADWAGFEARHAASAARGRLRGRAVSTFLEWTGGNALAEQVKVRVAPDGFVELTCATMPMGQGLATSYAQLAVDVFEVPIDRIRVRMGDTDLANGFGSAGSRSLFVGGSVVGAASRKGLERARELAGEALEAPVADLEYRNGRFSVAGTDLGIGLFELAARQGEQGITAEDGATAGAPSWPNGCHVCEVEVDPATGTVAVVAYASVNDIGRVVSPVIVQGQIEGGAVQGIGQALCEAVVYDDASGQLLSASFMDYALPHADGFLGFQTAFDQSVPCTTNALGAKGVGELGTIGATPTVVNAVVDALRRAGHGAAARQLQMPLTAERVWRALQA
ncbi:MAG: xanthine dehydrogenase family protein molybdopterin-binding subunit [Rubrivivax sp.]